MNKKSLKKNFLGNQKKSIILMLALVVVLAVAYIIVLGLNDDYALVLPKYDAQGDLLEYSYSSENGDKVSVVSQDENSITVDSESEIIYTSRPFVYPEISLQDLYSITVKNDSDEYSVYFDELSGEYLIKGNEMQLYQQYPMSELRFQARYMLSEQKLEGEYNTDESLKIFGLDNVSAPTSVTVTDKSGKTNTVLIGDELVSGGSYYAKNADKPFVYVLDSSAVIFFNNRNHFISPIIAPAISDGNYQYIEEFNMYKNGEPFFASSIIPEEIRASTGSTDMHRLSYPAKYPAALSGYYSALSCLATITGQKVVETNVFANEEQTEKLLEKYGLSEPTNNIYYKYNDEEYRFFTGTRFVDETGNVYYYAYSPYTDTIVIVPLENAPFLEYQLIDFIDASIFQVNIKNISSIEVNTSSGAYNFVLQGEGANLTVDEKNTGKVIDTPSFRQFFISLLNIKIDGYATRADVTGGTELSFKVTTKFGETSTYYFDTISTTRALITLDTSSEFYTNRAYITDILQKLEMLISGETITPDY